MDYTEKNQTILDEWRAKFIEDKKAEEEYADCTPEEISTLFAEDGIMNKGDYTQPDANGVFWRERSPEGIKENDLWSKTPLRVLFLTKDENAEIAWDVRGETFYAKHIKREQNVISGSFFYQNEACLLYGLLKSNFENSYQEFDGFTWEDALKLSEEQIFARVNLKKEIGGGKLENKDLQDAINKYFDYIKRQIVLLDADIFICCGSQSDNNIILNTLYDIYKDEFKYVDYGTGKGTAAHYNEKRNKLAIDAYHLAYGRNGGLSTRYAEIVGAYFDFIKYLKTTKGIDFTKHR
jgi:hypothetical protein